MVGGFESGHPVHGGGERDAVAGLGGFDGQADGEVGFAGTGRAEQYHVAGLGQEGAGA